MRLLCSVHRNRLTLGRTIGLRADRARRTKTGYRGPHPLSFFHAISLCVFIFLDLFSFMIIWFHVFVKYFHEYRIRGWMRGSETALFYMYVC